ESWRPRRADRSAVVGNRGLAGSRAATRPEAPLQAGCGDCDAASARGGNGRRGGERDRLAASYGARRLLGNPEEKARAHACLGQRGARPSVPHRRAGEPMKPPLHDASARQHSGEPSSGLGPVDIRNDRLRNRDLAELESCEIAGLVDRSTQELRRAWRTLHHTGPPLGLSRDLIIRGLADKLQQRAQGGPTRALQRRLRILAGEFERGARSFDPGGVLKTGATLVRQWRGHTHTVLVRENGFEYDGQRYRSLTVIAERITGAHWSGPRFFATGKRARASYAPSPANEKAKNRSAAEPKRPLCDLHPQIVRGGARAGVQFAAGAARSLRGLHRQPADEG